MVKSFDLDTSEIASVDASLWGESFDLDTHTKPYKSKKWSKVACEPKFEYRFGLAELLRQSEGNQQANPQSSHPTKPCKFKQLSQVICDDTGCEPELTTDNNNPKFKELLRKSTGNGRS